MFFSVQLADQQGLRDVATLKLLSVLLILDLERKEKQKRQVTRQIEQEKTHNTLNDDDDDDDDDVVVVAAVAVVGV